MVAKPRLTLIVPAHNAGSYLQRTLPAIRQALRGDFEFILVDDGSTDDTAALAAAAGAQVIQLPNKCGPSAARNEGAKQARGEFLAFLDADVEPRPDTLDKLLSSLEQHPEYAAVFGSYDDAPADTRLVSSFKNLMHHYVHQHGDPEAQTFWTGCGAIHRQVFEQVGPFRKVSIVCVEDIDYGHRLKDAGHRIWLRSDIHCKHLKPWSLWGLIRTDVMQRGVPWTVMMLRRGHVDNELNLNTSHRVSALLALGVGLSLLYLTAFFIIVGGALLFLDDWSGIGPAAAILGLQDTAMIIIPLTLLLLACLVLIQRNFYRFLVKNRGLRFAANCIPLHLLYYWYSMVSVAVGIIVHLTHPKQTDTPSPASRVQH